MARWSYSFVCTLRNLTVIIMQTIWRYWTPNNCHLHYVDCVTKIYSILSIIFHAIYGAVCIHLTHFSYDNCENVCTLSYYHHLTGSMAYLPLFRVRSWNNCCTVCIYCYEFVIWPDCFVGHSCPGGICPEIWSPVTDMQHYYLARYPTDDWQLCFNSKYVMKGILFRGCVSKMVLS